MRVKRFFAPDMRQAIGLVRAAQGPDAVILSNRSVDGGIEIDVAVDYDESLLNAGAAATTAQVCRQNNPLQSSIHANSHSPLSDSGQQLRTSVELLRWSQHPGLVAMRDELKQLRSLLENQLAHLVRGDLSGREPLHTDVIRRLAGMELDTAIIERVSASTVHASDEEHAWQLTLSEIAASIPIAGRDLMDQGGVFALVGSTGVGKTTSIAKLAARYVQRHGQRHVALVTTDSYRIGAHEQLLTYGRLLGIPVQTARDHKELYAALSSLTEKRLVLIDTAGMSQRDVCLSEQFAALAASGIPIRSLLVLSATAHPSVVKETVEAFSGVELEGAILTKLDEAASLGGVLTTVINHKLPLLFVTDGQRVPEDVQPANAQKLVRKAAELALRGGLPAQSMMAEKFAALRTSVHV